MGLTPPPKWLNFIVRSWRLGDLIPFPLILNRRRFLSCIRTWPGNILTSLRHGNLLLTVIRVRGKSHHSGLHPQPLVLIHPETAYTLGIREGNSVTIETPRGAIQQTACISDEVHPKVLGVDYAWWFPEARPAEGFGWCMANVDILTDDSPPFNPELGSINLRGLYCKIYRSNG